MKILSIELRGYDRFALNHYPVFLYQPSQKIQLLLGTNGSGKSSLMQELSPLPSEKADFKAGGGKTICIEHDGIRYTLSSTFKASGNKHSFIRHGDMDEELNQGGTAQVQRSLVEQMFGITPEIHTVLIGRDRFTGMSVAKRREWFTRMSKMDFDYAVEVYQKLKSRLRDDEQVLKFQQSTLLSESAKLVAEEDRQRLKDAISDHEAIVELLIQARDGSTTLYTQQTDAQVEEGIQSRIGEHRALLRQLREYGYQDDPAEYLNQKKTLEESLIAYRVRYEDLGRQIESQQAMIKLADELGTKEIGTLLQEHQNVLQEIISNRQALKWFKDGANPDEVGPALDLAYETLFDVLQELEPNPDKKYSKLGYQALQEELKQAQMLLRGHSERNMRLSQDIKAFEHAMEHQQTTCPQCRHVWIRDFDQTKYQIAQRESATTKEQIEILEKKVTDTTESIRKLTEYFERYRIYLRVRDQLSVLSVIWQEIEQRDSIFQDPKSVLHIIQQARGELPRLQAIRTLEHKSQEMQKLIALNEQSAEKDIKKLHNQVEQALLAYANLKVCIEQTVWQIRRLHTQVSIHQRLSEINTELESLLQEKDRISQSEIQRLKYTQLQDLIRQFNITLGEHKLRLQNADAQELVVNKLKEIIQTLTIERETLSAMVDAMSPKDGLIAKAMTGFINHFVGQMNKIISQIWLYPFELLPVNDSNDELDLNYRFAVQVKHKKIVPDISSCSAGMQEVVDLVFRIVSMQYLGLERAPIYLDEFGKSMDAAHRLKAFDAITKMVLHSHYSQIYIVSHYDAAYGGLSCADTVVLNPDNIVIPPGTIVNQVVTISED